MTVSPDTLRNLFIDGLKNAHALENQALSIMKPQVERIENYPAMAEQLRLHIGETNGQIERLETLLDGLGTSHSAIKDAALSLSGSMAAIAHSFAGDEILKNTFANHAFENFEIASYRSLIAMADAGDFSNATSALRQTLSEEERMAQWIYEHTPQITLQYAALYEQSGSNAKV
ncbi:MAG TPA: ferritin-like domain-containing protein [Mesorhizobium sp.]|jgi:ferritin-like metal-binding protein YciE|nr:ferritin-like domain-containing protein [Mesorhizobium sp.]